MQAIDVKDFGAVGDGVVDDSLAFQEAIRAVPQAGGTLFIPPGRYLVAAQVVVDKPIELRGPNTPLKASLILTGDTHEEDLIGFVLDPCRWLQGLRDLARAAADLARRVFGRGVY